MGEPLIFGPDARPNSHAARRLAPPCRFPSVPPCPSPKTYILPSVSFHTLGLSLFPGPCPNLGFPPLRHGRTPRFRPKRKAEQPCRPVRSEERRVGKEGSTRRGTYRESKGETYKNRR